MALISRAIFGCVRLVARHGVAESRDEESSKDAARRMGIHDETYAYWYLRRHGYVFVARNDRVPEDKGESDLVGYDGSVLAFVGVKTRSGTEEHRGQLEEAINAEKRRHWERMAKRFMAERRTRDISRRFDLVAMESRSGRPPEVRLYKNVFAAKN